MARPNGRPPTTDSKIATLAGSQGGHVTREQLRRLGLSRRAVEHRLARGSLIAVHHGIYAVGHLPAGPLDRARGALLATGPRSALAGASALAYWTAAREWPAIFELVSARDRRPAGIVVHHCSTLLRRDVRAVQGLRITSPARTALDLAPRLGERRLTRIVNDLRHQNRLLLEQLDDVVQRNPRHPGAAPLRELAGLGQHEPTRSELEDAFLRLLRRHSLPTPQLNVRVAGHRVDAYFPHHELVVELDGRLTHGDDWRRAFEEDRARMVDVLLATGQPTIRFTWEQITRQGRRTAAKLAAILESRRHLQTGPGRR